jgi:S-adenosylmethionine synthetase
MARKIAVEILKQTKSQEVFVEVCYAIGKKEPLGLKIKVDGKNFPINKELINRFIPNNIIKELKLKTLMYRELSM